MALSEIEKEEARSLRKSGLNYQDIVDRIWTTSNKATYSSVWRACNLERYKDAQRESQKQAYQRKQAQKKNGRTWVIYHPDTDTYS